MSERDGRFYYGRNCIALGDDFPDALRKYADLHKVTRGAETFAEVAAEYLSKGTSRLARKTLAEYERQIPVLVRVFGNCRLDQIRPVHVRRYLTARGDTIAGAREKALLQGVISWARNVGIYDGANPCAGIRARKSKRTRYVTDVEFRAVLDAADPMLRDFLELAYFTGQRPSDVLKMMRADVRDGALWVAQGKTGAKVRIAVVGPLAAVVERLTGYPVGSVYLVRDERGQRLTLSALRKRFWIARAKAGADWQIRDLRAKAASDLDTAQKAQALLGHSSASTTDGYIRARVGQVVSPVLRETRPIAGKPKAEK
jgi:integrase